METGRRGTGDKENRRVRMFGRWGGREKGDHPPNQGTRTLRAISEPRASFSCIIGRPWLFQVTEIRKVN